MKAMFVAGAIAVAAGAVGSVRAPETGAHAVVVRAKVPFAIGETCGSASYGGEGWRVVVGWRSEKGRTGVGVAVATRASSTNLSGR